MIAIIDSGGANIASVRFALERCGAEAELTKNRKKIEAASKVILPGVGAAAMAMQTLQTHGLVDCIRQLKQPVLGLCLGMQLLFERSDEGNVEMLGILTGSCGKFQADEGRSVPHMGWNQIHAVDSGTRHSLLTNVPDGAHVYFVHSYYAGLSGETIASCNYGPTFTAIAGHENFMGCQFHPEKSGAVGEQIIRNFLAL
jgi:glutamine amidotransferase